MSRINLVKSIGPVLQIAEGWTANCRRVHRLLDERTDQTWLHWFMPHLSGKGLF
jgi:L-fucose isomerase